MNHSAKVATQKDSGLSLGYLASENNRRNGESFRQSRETEGLRPLPMVLSERKSFGETVDHSAKVAPQKDLGHANLIELSFRLECAPRRGATTSAPQKCDKKAPPNCQAKIIRRNGESCGQSRNTKGLRPLPRVLSARKSFGETVNHAAKVATQNDLGLSPGYLASANHLAKRRIMLPTSQHRTGLGLSPGYLASANHSAKL